MAKSVTFEFPESEATELETILAQMRSANEQMRRDQADIEQLKQETNAIALQTRSLLEQLETTSNIC